MSLSRYDSSGYSGNSYDRNVFEANLSTVNKLQRDYWNAKQVLRKKLGKEEDKHVVASDAELDSKLDLFHSVQRTCSDLIKTVEKYQKCICVLSRDENAMGRFLKDQGALDSTPAGKMMTAVGKAQCYTSQQRLNLRHSLGRLHHDVETFRYRAVGDSVLSVDQMEASRTHYRASLRWMQDISSSLDPEQFKKLEKFRKVQNEVRLNKEKFDRQKWAVCQKVDLLCASRSNLFSNTLVPYQNDVLKFWEKTAHTMAAVLENIKDCNSYEFKLLKALNPLQDFESVKDEDSTHSKEDKNEEDSKSDDQQLISLNDPELLDKTALEESLKELDIFSDDKELLINLNVSECNGDFKDVYHDQSLPFDTNDKQPLIFTNVDLDTNKADENLLLGNFNENDDDHQPSKEDLDLLNDILGNEEKSEPQELEQQWQSVFGDFVRAPNDTTDETPEQNNDFLQDSLMQNSSSTSAPGGGKFLPSQLMDMMMMTDQPSSQYNTNPQAMQPGAMHQSFNMGVPYSNTGQMMGYQPPSYQSMFGNSAPSRQQPNNGQSQAMSGPTKKDGKGNMSAWFNLFAELDPLQNPDALGKKKDGGKKDGGAC